MPTESIAVWLPRSAARSAPLVAMLLKTKQEWVYMLRKKGIAKLATAVQTRKTSELCWHDVKL